MGGVRHSSSTVGTINIGQAENSFHELSRQLTQGTVVDDKHGAKGPHPRTSGDSRTAQDLEKGVCDAEQSFDLREYLTSSNDANQKAGIKHKHVGVIWEDLHVDVLGGSDLKVGLNASLNRHGHRLTRSGKQRWVRTFGGQLVDCDTRALLIIDPPT